MWHKKSFDWPNVCFYQTWYVCIASTQTHTHTHPQTSNSSIIYEIIQILCMDIGGQTYIVSELDDFCRHWLLSPCSNLEDFVCKKSHDGCHRNRPWWFWTKMQEFSINCYELYIIDIIVALQTRSKQYFIITNRYIEILFDNSFIYTKTVMWPPLFFTFSRKKEVLFLVFF